MDIRWKWLLLACVVLSAMADDEEEKISSAEQESDEEAALALDEEETRNLRPRAYTPTAYSNTLPSGFRASPSLAELAGYQRPQQQEEQEERTYANVVPTRGPQGYEQQEQRQPLRGTQRKSHDIRPSKLQHLDEDELEEKEEPDRLSILLQQSKFNCVNRNSGYYADEELNCEVFHYCQDSVKHSWICPDGFTFHQVHLICMPPNHDNICQQSSQYHVVNDYLYRPINQEEVQRKPNVALKYSDRYYPSEVYRDDRYELEDEEEEPPRRLHTTARPSPRPQILQGQVFRSAEEVNIPLVQRRPQRPYEYEAA